MLHEGLIADNPFSSIPTVGFNMKRVQKGHVTLKWFVISCSGSMHALIELSTDIFQLGSRRPAPVPFHVGKVLSRSERHSVSPASQDLRSRRTTHSPSTRFIVDSADKEALPVAKEELHILLEKPAMEGIPLLVLGNKSDLRGHLTVDELIDSLDLKRVTHREVSCYGISAKEETNLDAVLQWLIARSTK
jgi:ADP-ribosylation factor-like protein 8